MSGASDLFRLDGLLRDAARRSPERAAVRDSHQTLTYAELDAAADRIAAALASQGVHLGDRVGVFLPKSVRAVAALYGIMRAGAAYVPIDPSSPAARAAYILTDAGISALVSDAARVAALREEDAAAAPRGIVCDGTADGFAGWEDVLAGSEAPPRIPAVDIDLAYILYTSGSTGQPKGVAISHRNCLTFIRWAVERLELSREDVFSQHAPLHFDLSTLDLYGAAAVGATVAIVPPEAAMFPIRLASWIRESGITVWYSVPSALTMLVRYGRLAEGPLDGLRLLVFAGEVFPVRYLRELMLTVPRARYFNLYGPTETNVCTYEEVTAPPAEDAEPVSIGRACENTRCAVVDEAGAVLTEVGAEGELVVTGSGVAQGYWGDPARTAKGFTAPYTYRTGDLVQILDRSPNPRYRFVGRRDHMIKTRGYRVELGEVEAAIYTHPEVAESIAVAVPDELMGSRIVAFSTLVNGVSVTPEQLQSHCRTRLPSYMVPDRMFVLEALPRTSNDKYDRQALTALAVAEHA